LKEDLRFRRGLRLVLLPKSRDPIGVNLGIRAKV
jgi:hypothetical protein